MCKHLPYFKFVGDIIFFPHPALTRQPPYVGLMTKIAELFQRFRRVPANSHQRCGIQLFDDFKELRPGAAAELASSLHRMHNDSPSHQTSRNRGLQGLGESFRQQISKRISAWSATSKSSLPTHNHTKSGSPSVELASPPNAYRLFLLNCIGHSKYITKLSQPHLEDVKTDRQLFYFMRKEYSAKHWYRRLRSYRTLTGLDFVQVCVFAQY